MPRAGFSWRSLTIVGLVVRLHERLRWLKGLAAGQDAATSPYPDRIVAKPGHEAELAKRTLTNLYNQRPAWLAKAHEALDVAVAAAYGWSDYTPAMPDEEILRRLLALNHERSAAGQAAAAQPG